MWIDNAGSQLNLSGGLVDNRMVLISEPFKDQSGQEKQHQISWTPYNDGTVRQEWVVINLANDSSSTLFNGLYRKVKRDE